MRNALSLSLAAALSVACAPIPPLTVLPPPQRPGYAGYSSPHYADDKSWLCRPDLPSDGCRVDLTATEIHPDRSRTIVPFVPAAAPKVDCFYVYPTVDHSVVPGNHTDFADLEPMARTAAAQFARLGEVCRVFAPLYRQVTIGTYLFGGAGLEARLAVAFSDVADAFAHYHGQYNQGRRIVLVEALAGRGDGGAPPAPLLRGRSGAARTARLVLAMPIGGTVEVPRGRLTGGTFATLPVCTRPDELGCVVAFRTHRAGSDVDPGSRLAPAPGRTSVCVNPASAGGDERRAFSRTYLPVTGRALRAACCAGSRG